jgi:hypothetical protein
VVSTLIDLCTEESSNCSLSESHHGTIQHVKKCQACPICQIYSLVMDALHAPDRQAGQSAGHLRLLCTCNVCLLMHEQIHACH